MTDKPQTMNEDYPSGKAAALAFVLFIVIDILAILGFVLWRVFHG